MTDIAILTATCKTTLDEIVKQAHALGTGLQNAAPGDKIGTPNKSIEYLFAIADALAKISEDCGNLLENLNEAPKPQNK